MGVQLLERDHLLDELAHLLDEAAHGTGRSALVSGEAGIGKSALIERFVELHSASARFYWGRCEALFTPRPLGPLHDIAQQLQGRTYELLEHEANRTAIFSAFLEALSAGPTPTVVVIEDAHWADEATLDLLKFLGRRVQQVPILLIITYRDDEIGPNHPLRFVLGDLPSRSTKRLRLVPLSREAVTVLAHRAIYADLTNLYSVTGGNPFFVTEVLASDDGASVPDTVRDAVLARAARLSPQGHAVLELASIVPARAELWLLQAFLPQSSSAIEECIQAGVLRPESEAVAFRHELARLAIESTLPSHRQKALHAEVLHALLERDKEHTSLARLVHHATLAGDSAAVVKFAPDAARQAAQQGAHRESATHYETALSFARTLSNENELSLEQRAGLLEGRAYECYLTNQLEAAALARTEALDIWRELGVGEAIGRNLRWLSRNCWFMGSKAAAEHYATEVITELECLPPGEELAMAYSNLSQLRMLEGNFDGAVEWGTRALELAATLGADDITVHALNNVGTAQYGEGDERGFTKLATSLQMALAQGYEEHAARAYTNLGSSAVGLRQYARASHYLNAGILYCTEHDLDSWRLYMLGWQARLHLELGDWTKAAEAATTVLASNQTSAITRVSALVVLALVRLRRGDPGSDPLLEEAQAIAINSGEAQRIVPVAAAHAEAAWLRGDMVICQREAQAGYEQALEYGHAWELAQLSYWLWKRGNPSDLPHNRQLPEPYALMFAGDWAVAAAAWERLGCLYEQALALSEGTVQA